MLHQGATPLWNFYMNFKTISNKCKLAKPFIVIFSLAFLIPGCSGDKKESNNAVIPTITPTPEPEESPLLTQTPVPTFTPKVSPPQVSNTNSFETGEIDSTYCAPFTTSLSFSEGNMYTFNAPGNTCFGILDDGGQKKTLPLSTTEVIIGSHEIQIGSEIKLYNSHPDLKQFRELYFTFEITNTSDSHMCFVNSIDVGVSLYNESGDEIALLFADSFLDGVLSTITSSQITTNTCIGAGQTLRYVEETDGIPVDVINAASYAIAGNFDGSLRTVETLVDLASTQLDVDGERVVASFVNDTGSAISLGFLTMIFFDEEGYAINRGFLSRLDDVTDRNYVESGASFTVGKDILNPRIWPTHATEGIIYLDWEYEGDFR